MMLRYWLLFILLLVIFNPVCAQRKSKLNTNGKGTLFIYGGLNRAFYAPSTLHFLGENFDFKLDNTSLTDGFSESMNTLQYNLHLGYYIAPKWALTVGVDKWNVFMSENQELQLSGTFAPGAHSNFSGSYENNAINPSREDLFYRQTAGTHYVRFGFLKSGQHQKTANASFELLSHLGAGIGLLVSNTDFTFDGTTAQQNISTSGFGINAIAGIRAVFAQHVFLQFNLTGGLLNHRAVVLHPFFPRSLNYTSFYVSPEISIGFSLFVRPTDCGTCPKW